jgi:hypothetical protein
MGGTGLGGIGGSGSGIGGSTGGKGSGLDIARGVPPAMGAETGARVAAGLRGNAGDDGPAPP